MLNFILIIILIFLTSQTQSMEAVKSRKRPNTALRRSKRINNFPNAILRNDSEMFQHCIDTKSEINERFNANKTALHFAVKAQNIPFVLELLNRKASVNCQDRRGRTPLSKAVSSSHLQILQILIENGANPSIADSDTKSPLHYAAMNGQNTICEALITGGALVNDDSHIVEPFALAWYHQNIITCKILIEAGAKLPNPVDFELIGIIYDLNSLPGKVLTNQVIDWEKDSYPLEDLKEALAITYGQSKPIETSILYRLLISKEHDIKPLLIKSLIYSISRNDAAATKALLETLAEHHGGTPQENLEKLLRIALMNFYFEIAALLLSYKAPTKLSEEYMSDPERWIISNKHNEFLQFFEINIILNNPNPDSRFSLIAPDMRRHFLRHFINNALNEHFQSTYTF